MKIVTPILLVMLIVSGIAALSCASAEDAIKRGDEHHKMGRYDKAIQEYVKALEIDPESASAYYGIGNAHLEAGRLAQAEDDYDKAIRLNPTLPDPYKVLSVHYYSRAKAHLEAGRLAQAEDDYDKAIRLNPTLPDLYNALSVHYYNRANVHLEAGRLTGAKNDYDKSVHLNPDFTNPRFKLRLDGAIWVDKAAKERQRAKDAAGREKQRLARVKAVSQIIGEYEANAVAFESKFYGERMEVTGIVDSVQERVLESGYRITLRENFDTIDCNVVESNRDMVISLARGQIIDVAGTVGDGIFGPDLYDCVVTHVTK